MDGQFHPSMGGQFHPYQPGKAAPFLDSEWTDNFTHNNLLFLQGYAQAE